MLHRAGKASRDVLITGGAEFLGAHLGAHLLATSDAHVTVVDDLVDHGALQNIEWLKSQARDGRLNLVRGHTRNTLLLADAASTADEIYFLADPCSTDDNGAMKAAWIVLEAARRSGLTPALICASASGGLGGRSAIRRPFADKAAGESSTVARFVTEFARHHRLPAVTLQMDTVTGPRQFDESLDWVAHTEYAILSGRRCRIAGDASRSTTSCTSPMPYRPSLPRAPTSAKSPARATGSAADRRTRSRLPRWFSSSSASVIVTRRSTHPGKSAAPRPAPSWPIPHSSSTQHGCPAAAWKKRCARLRPSGMPTAT